MGTGRVVDEGDKARVGVGLVECEVDFIVGGFEGVLEGEGVVVLEVVMVPGEVGLGEGDVVSPFEPPLPLPALIHRKY